MYPPEAIDFDGLPAATQARIRERLAYRDGAAAGMAPLADVGRQVRDLKSPNCVKAAVSLHHHTQPEGGE